MNPGKPKTDQPPIAAKLAIVIPAFNEAEAIGQTLDELFQALDRLPFATRPAVAVGDNGSTDRTGAIAKEKGALVGRDDRAGYGYGCLAAIAAVKESGFESDGWLFMASDGANDPADIERLAQTFEETGANMVLGARTHIQNLRGGMSPVQWLANRALGLCCGPLGGRAYRDLGPFRIIARDAFEKLKLSEMTYGWTIEPQILAPRLGLKTVEIPVAERRRKAGEQKVSGVSLRKTAAVGAHIFQAGLRARKRRLQ